MTIGIWQKLTGRPLYGLSIVILGAVVIVFVNWMVGAVVIAAGLIIRIEQVKRIGTDAPRRAIINCRVYFNCQLCPYVTIKPNPWSKTFPTYQCSEKDDKFNYIPGKIPRWCPYAVK